MCTIIEGYSSRKGETKICKCNNLKDSKIAKELTEKMFGVAGKVQIGIVVVGMVVSVLSVGPVPVKSV